MPAPPKDLAKLHFGYLDLKTLDRRPTSRLGRSDDASSAPLAAIRADFPIIQLIDCDEAIVTRGYPKTLLVNDAKYGYG